MNKEEFLQNHTTERQEQGDISVAEAAEKWGISISQAMRRLNGYAKQGILRKFTGTLLSGETGCFYRIVV